MTVFEVCAATLGNPTDYNQLWAPLIFLPWNASAKFWILRRYIGKSHSYHKFTLNILYNTKRAPTIFLIWNASAKFWILRRYTGKPHSYRKIARTLISKRPLEPPQGLWEARRLPKKRNNHGPKPNGSWPLILERLFSYFFLGKFTVTPSVGFFCV